MEHNKELSSPFLDVLSFEFEATNGAIGPIGQSPLQLSESPFQSVYELENDDSVAGPEVNAHDELLNELYDDEFNYVIYEFANQVADLHELQFEQQIGTQYLSPAVRVQRLYEHFTPLVRETDLFFEAFDREIGQQPDNELGDAELDKFIDQYQFQHSLPPGFEYGFGSWIKKKVNKAVNKAKDYAKKKAKALGKRLLRAALSKLKKYARRWLNEIIKFAINKLPAKYQPIAKIVANKLGIKVAGETMETVDSVVNSSAAISQLQHKFDRVTADLMLAESESQQDYILAEAMVTSEDNDPTVEQLFQARQQFKDGLLALGEAEEPNQLVENFLPAILPMIKLGLKFYGRPKLVRYIATYIARFIKKFVPKQYLKPLSQAIVDAGLRLINLEASEEDVNEVALEAITDTVQETIQRIAALPEYILENEAMLEGFVLEAFETAATVNLPPILSDKVYQERPELRESMMFNAVWAKQPLRGRKAYKKYTHVFETQITPHIAKSVKTWRGIPLASVLRKRYGLRNKGRVKARVHVYEATPGTWLSRIAKHETQVAGLGSTTRSAWSKLMPLTEQAAAVLLGEPRLGRPMPARYLADPLTIGVGQRFYYLEFPSERMVPTTTMLSTCCNAHVVLDFAQNRLSTSVFLSEAEARQIALTLRQKMPLGTTLTVLNRAIQEGMGRAFGDGAMHQIKVIHGGLGSQNTSAAALNWLPAQLLAQLQARLVQWQMRRVTDYLQEQSHAFVTAVDDPANGVTLQTTLLNPPGLSEIGRFLAGASMSLASLQVQDRLPQAEVMIRAGYGHG